MVSTSIGTLVRIVLCHVGVSVLPRPSAPGKSHALFRRIRNRDGLDLDDC